MKNFAIIEGTSITNVVVWSGDTAEWQPPEGTRAVELPEGVGIGWSYVDGKFVAPVVAKEPEVVHVPASITKRQAALALYDAGKYDAVMYALGQDPRANIEWMSAANIERQSPLVLQLGEALGLDLDTLFIHAATL